MRAGDEREEDLVAGVQVRAPAGVGGGGAEGEGLASPGLGSLRLWV